MRAMKPKNNKRNNPGSEMHDSGSGNQESVKNPGQTRGYRSEENRNAKKSRAKLEGLGAMVSVYWPEDWKSIILNPKQWAEILAGNPYAITGRGFYYEGEKFNDGWFFNRGKRGELIVTYGDDGGTGFTGTLEDADIEEFLYNRISKKEMFGRMDG